MKKIFKELTIPQFILLLLCIFEVVCVSFTFLRWDLTALVIVYGVLCVILTGIFIRTGAGHSFLLKKKKYEWMELLYMAVALALIIFQLYVVMFYQHSDADDAWYVGTSVTAWQTDRLFEYSPYTGNLLDWSDAKEYILSPFPILMAVVARILHIHPTILCHEIVPVVVISVAYWVYGMLGTELFGATDKMDGNVENSHSSYRVWLFLIFISLLNLFGFYSTRTTGTFLLLRSWQGKAVYCAVMLPLMFYYMLKVFKEPSGKWLIGVYLTSFASCMICFSAVTLTPMLAGTMCLIYAIVKKDLKVPFQLAGSVIINVVLLAMYVLI